MAAAEKAFGRSGTKGCGPQALADENLRLKKRLAFEEQQNAKLRQEL